MGALLRVSGVSKSFGQLVALSDVHFEVVAGTILGIVGPNGSGKSTLFNAITGIPFRPDGGVIEFDNHTLQRLSPHAIAQLGLIRTFQLETTFETLTVAETFSVVGRGKAAPQLAASLVERWGFDTRMDVASSRLSLLERKQLMIVTALLMCPKLLLLDEPASGLSKPAQVDLVATLKEIRSNGVTVIIIEHVLSVLTGVADRILVLDAGTVLTEGTPEEITSDPRVIRAYLGTSVRGGQG